MYGREMVAEGFWHPHYHRFPGASWHWEVRVPREKFQARGASESGDPEFLPVPLCGSVGENEGAVSCHRASQGTVAFHTALLLSCVWQRDHTDTGGPSPPVM